MEKLGRLCLFFCLMFCLLWGAELKAKTIFDYPCIPEWNTSEIVLQGVFITLTTIDMMQTYSSLYSNSSSEELNPIIGSRPSKKRFFGLGIGWLVLHTGLIHVSSHPIRFLIQNFFIVVETTAILHNHSIGARINF